MYFSPAASLYSASALTFIAALLHYACIFWGADGFRLLGAGESIARMAEDGRIYPIIIAGLIGTVLTVCSVYAFTSAGGSMKLPFALFILFATGAVFLARGLAFPLIKPLFPDNSTTFWLVTSGICLLIGSLYIIGAIGLSRSSTIS